VYFSSDVKNSTSVTGIIRLLAHRGLDPLQEPARNPPARPCFRPIEFCREFLEQRAKVRRFGAEALFRRATVNSSRFALCRFRT